MDEQTANQISQEVRTGQSTLLELFRSDRLFDRSIAYEIVTEPSERAKIASFVARKEYPEESLRYLLDCISADIEYSDYIHSRSDAFFELTVPRDRYWENESAAISSELYWKLIRNFIEAHPCEYFEEVVTHFLEGFGVDDELVVEMRFWKKNVTLCKYVYDLEGVLGGSF